jgi:3-(3-hydroxy-phenyl)propionate hydroxylase
VFDEGLFWRERGARKLLAGSMLPQVRVRVGDGPFAGLSDDVFGAAWSLVGFGVDPVQFCDGALLERWHRIGGKTWQWCLPNQASDLAPANRRLHELDESVLPRSVESGWIAVVRPDRCVMAEGPASQLPSLLGRALDTVEATQPARLLTPLPAAA